ncbi:hypothetical protein ACI2KX_16060 [Ectopseudomonas khazarica]|uniref:hypothetical protein n=1 Tax=Ectopseudomonas khazarica TaxID=2502979 RepID=UPI0038505DFD
MAEQQQSPDDCVKCGASFSSPAAETESPRRGVWIATLSIVVIACIASAVFWGYSSHQRNVLVSQVETSMRTANGLVSEILDDKASLTKAGYLEKVPRRIADLDDLLASTLAINDQHVPGLTAAAADYVRASRAFLNAVTEDLRQSLRLSMAESGYRLYESYPLTLDGAKYLAMSQAEIEAINRSTLSAVSVETDLSRKIELLRVANEHAKQTEKRIAYLKSLDELRAARAAKEQRLREMDSTGRTIRTAGERVSGLSGRPMPIQSWEIPGS